LESAGYQVVLSVDNDPAAVTTHLANFPGPCLEADLSDPDRVADLLALLEGLEIDLIAGGPPCQPFSRAGRSKIRDLVDKGIREALDPRRELWRAFLQVVTRVRPRAVLLENVPDMALGDDMRTVRFLMSELDALGYETDMRILEAWRHGVPQHRQRLIVVAVRDAIPKWPKYSEMITLADAISDLPELGDTIGARALPYSGPNTEFQRLARAGCEQADENLVFDHMTRRVREDDKKAFQLMAQGYRYTDLPKKLKRYRDDIFDDKYNRLSWSELSRSITAHIAKDGYWYIHPSEDRTLTVREAARIQTFPDHFRFSGTRSDAFRLIGNAVPPTLGAAMATAIREALDQGESSSTPPPSQVRSTIRQRLIGWVGQNRGPAWRRSSTPWHVLVGTVAGRGDAAEALAEEILRQIPDPETVDVRQVENLARRTKDPRSRRIIRAIGKAAQSVQQDGWDSGRWASAAGLTDSQLLWIEAVGFGSKHVVATTGTVRVAGRAIARIEATGVSGRLLLASLVGYSEESSRLTAALAGVADVFCSAREPRCTDCPLAGVCLTSLPAALGKTG
jgi:DNA (cytosine-5)-methyltransferase 1